MISAYTKIEARERSLKLYRRQYKPGRLVEGQTVLVEYNNFDGFIYVRDFKNERKVRYSITSVKNEIPRVAKLQRMEWNFK